MFGGTGCCGADFTNNKATVFGLMTLSMPLMAVLPLSLLLLAPLCPISGRVRSLARRITIILKANWSVIKSAGLIPRLRCWLAGRLFGLSPRISGFVYRVFNVAVLCCLWGVVIGAVWAGFVLVGG